MILLVTGSRDWPVGDKRDIFNHLHRWYGEQSQGWPPDERLTVRHGAARGVDTWASEWVDEARQILGEEWMDLIQEDPHPVSHAEWTRNPRYAGHNRNIRMVNMDPPPDYVIAFSYAQSTGTAGCWRHAHVISRIPGLFISWEVLHGGNLGSYSDLAGRGGLVAPVPRAEQPARAPGDPYGDRLF